MTKLIQRAAAEVFDDDVGLSHQVRVDGAGVRVLEVQRHTQLIAQAIESGNGNIVFRFPTESGSVWAKVGSVGSATVTTRRVLNLDHFGAQPSQN